MHACICIQSLIHYLCCYAIQDEEVVACKLKGVAESVDINVRFFNGSKFCVEAALESFKELVVGNCDIPIQNQRLIHKGKILQNHQSHKSYEKEEVTSKERSKNDSLPSDNA
ncbi:putative ubiquilin [Medicago truncatula]|uniref:Putative ubiquilin n=1 Tax=Medicago truncatula TaxID=3880 RepID=A0A396GNK3_MEDTR|nr:putative ubiquilin [Medicago truncatula]